MMSISSREATPLRELVGALGFEPRTSTSQTWRANRTALRPETCTFRIGAASKQGQAAEPAARSGQGVGKAVDLLEVGNGGRQGKLVHADALVATDRGADRLRRFDQHLRRPERVVQVEPVGFEFGGESAVEDEGVGRIAVLGWRRAVLGQAP